MKYFAYLTVAIFLFSCNLEKGGDQSAVFDIDKHLIADSAMVVSAHPLATKAGLEILKAGGNAIDAMVAVHFALAVVYPRAGNLGGGGFMVYRDAKGNCSTLDFREKAPASAHRDMYLDSLGNANDSLSIFGHLACGVPGSVEGMYVAHQRYGRINWSRLIESAIEYAEEGILVTQREAETYNYYQALFAQYNPHPNALVKEDPWQKGDLLVQKDLAKTLIRIKDQGRKGFYEGETAALTVKEIQKNGGIMTIEDLKQYHAVWRNPIQFDYGPYKVLSMPPPSSGGICLAELLNMIEPYDIGQYGFQSPKSVHLMVEAARRAYADRAEHLGDMDFYPVPIDTLTSQDFADLRMKNFEFEKASSSDSISHAVLPPSESEETTHYCIVDAEGNAISVTTTINSNFGNKVIVQGAGFLLNNEMDDFSAKPGSPNQFGLLGNEANAIAPGKRMLSSMTPTIVEKDGAFFLALGTPGGSTIIMSVFQVITNLVAFDMALKEAVHKPRFHFQWKPDVLFYEAETFAEDQLSALNALGHTLEERAYIGQLEAILRVDNNKLEGVADIRGNDSAMGY